MNTLRKDIPALLLVFALLLAVPAQAEPSSIPQFDGRLEQWSTDDSQQETASPYTEIVRADSAGPEALTGLPLKIAGQTFGPPMEVFNAANPDVSFSFIDVHPETTMDLVTHMMGDTAADVYSVYLHSYSLDSLYEKGCWVFCQPCGQQVHSKHRRRHVSLYPGCTDARWTNHCAALLR